MVWASLAAAAPTLSSIGSFASGLGSLASGFGLGGDDGPGFTEQKNMAQDFTASQIRAKMLGSARFATEAGKKYGLHPTVLLGQGGGQSATFQSGGGKSWNPAEIGQGVDRALNAGRSATQRKLDELALEKAGLENDYIRTQIAASQKAISGTAPTVAIRGNTDDTGNVEIVPHKVTSKKYEDSALAAGLPPGFMRYDLGNNQTIELPYSEEGPSEALENLPLGLDYLKFAELYGKRNLSKAALRKKWRQYKAHENRVSRRKFYNGIVKPIWNAKKWKK